MAWLASFFFFEKNEQTTRITNCLATETLNVTRQGGAANTKTRTTTCGTSKSCEMDKSWKKACGSDAAHVQEHIDDILVKVKEAEHKAWPVERTKVQSLHEGCGWHNATWKKSGGKRR